MQTSIAVVGGTGAEGTGLALRFAKAGSRVRIGSRNAAKAETAAMAPRHGSRRRPAHYPRVDS